MTFAEMMDLGQDLRRKDDTFRDGPGNDAWMDDIARVASMTGQVTTSGRDGCDPHELVIVVDLEHLL